MEKARYCSGCKATHKNSDVGGWPNSWNSKKIKGRTLYWCRASIDCYGCGFVHVNETGFTRIDSRGSLCGKWAKASSSSMNKKLENMSPEEVMSGMHFGADRDPSLPQDTENYSKAHQKQVKELQEAL